MLQMASRNRSTHDSWEAEQDRRQLEGGMMRASKTMVISLGLLAGVLVGCAGPTSIPPGAQQVHVVVTGSEVRLEPATARAGDIYFVVDTPGAEVSWVQRMSTEEETPGPMSDADLARLARGDTQGMSLTCCFGTGEPYGNVHKVALSPGKYALLTRQPETPGPIAVLEVLP
jgi:hypothetical protein